MEETPRTQFLTTHWSRLLSGDGDSLNADSNGLAFLCEAYHYPVYALIRNRLRVRFNMRPFPEDGALSSNPVDRPVER